MIPIVAGVALAVLVGVVWALRARAAYEERFPPISDAVFLAGCRPGTAPVVALKVRRIVADHFAIEYARVSSASIWQKNSRRSRCGSVQWRSRASVAGVVSGHPAFRHPGPVRGCG